VTSSGHPRAFFQRAIEGRNLIAAEAAARELGRLTLSDALMLLELYADKDFARFERAAVRWHGRLELEARRLTLSEARFALAALAALGGEQQRHGRALLQAFAARAGPLRATGGTRPV